MKKNKIKIDGDNNTAFSDLNNSKVQIGSSSKATGNNKQFWTIAGVIIALLTLFLALIVDWNKLADFFK